MVRFAYLDENNVVVAYEQGSVPYTPDLEGLVECTPERKNMPEVGYTYDPQRDAFIPPKPYPSWLLDETTCLWESPTAYPNDGGQYTWNEASLSWEPNANNTGV